MREVKQIVGVGWWPVEARVAAKSACDCGLGCGYYYRHGVVFYTKRIDNLNNKIAVFVFLVRLTIVYLSLNIWDGLYCLSYGPCFMLKIQINKQVKGNMTNVV